MMNFSNYPKRKILREDYNLLSEDYDDELERFRRIFRRELYKVRLNYAEAKEQAFDELELEDLYNYIRESGNEFDTLLRKNDDFKRALYNFMKDYKEGDLNTMEKIAFIETYNICDGLY